MFAVAVAVVFGIGAHAQDKPVDTDHTVSSTALDSQQLSCGGSGCQAKSDDKSETKACPSECKKDSDKKACDGKCDGKCTGKCGDGCKNECAKKSADSNTSGGCSKDGSCGK